ncbi:sulfite exporter TauE/SafE family protein, partial [Streptomyces amritsarensis]
AGGARARARRCAAPTPPPPARKAFGWFVVVMGVFVLGRQIPAAAWTAPLTWTGAGLAGVAAVAWGRVRARRPRPGRDAHPASPHASRALP